MSYFAHNPLFMKKIYPLTLILLVSTAVFGQKGIFYQAKYLRDHYTAGTVTTDDNLAAAMNGLYSGSEDDIINALHANPFFTNIRFERTNLVSMARFGFSAASLAGLDVTNIANGVADLLIERAKEELTAAFFDRFQSFAKANPEFSILFPKTTQNLANLLTYSYPQMLPALRAGFLDDIRNITLNLGAVMDLPRYRSLLKNFPEVRIMIRSLRLVHELETGASNAADILVEFSGFAEWTDPASPVDLQNAGSGIKVAKVFSESIRNNGNGSIWVPGSSLKQLFYDDVFLNFYLGLLYRQFTIDDASFQTANGNRVLFSAVLLQQKGNVFLFQSKLKEFFDLASKVDATLSDIQAKKDAGNSPSNDDYYNYINVAIDAVDYGCSLIKIFDPIPTADTYLSIARRSNQLYKDIYTKQYTQAISDAIEIFRQLDTVIAKKVSPAASNAVAAALQYNGPAAEDLKKLAEGDGFLKPITQKNIDAVVQAQAAAKPDAPINAPDLVQLTQLRVLQKFFTFLEQLRPYALFMANVVEAKNEDAVKAALENAILPVGSSSIKKNTICNISVQAYLGAFYSGANGNHAVLSTWQSAFGVIAPIGLSWTPGWLSWKKGGSLSVFGSIFDLGAIVDYKLKKDPSVTGGDSVVSKDYSVKLGQLFSPGAYLVYGAPFNLPLSLGFGGQYGPGLSKIDPGNGVAVTNPYWRWSIFLTVDLPLFNIVNRTKKN